MKLTTLLDMDEVLMGFRDPALRGSGIDIDDPDVIKVLLTDDWKAIEALCGGRSEFCAPVTAAGVQFWEDMKPLPWAHDLIAALREVPDNEILIVTSPSFWPESGPVKIRQLKEIFGIDDYCLCHSKQMLAAPNKILIDDAEHNVVKFKEAGGHTFRWPNPTQIRHGGKTAGQWIDEAVQAVFEVAWSL